MTPQRWQEIERTFDLVADRPAAQRAALLADLDPEIRAEVEKLLRSDGAGAPLLRAAVEEAESFAGFGAERFGPYRLTGKLGQGGMGAVYLAVRDDGSFDKQVAIKVLHLGLHTPAALDRFRQERQILASLEHPGIARILDGGETADGSPYIVLEYVEGQPLHEYCERWNLRRDERLRLLLRVCEAVEYAHGNLVVHRDLKPANILVTADGSPKLLDFGIAKLLDSKSQHGATITYALTPEYASPEQVRGQPVTTATDVYSLGVILYELLTGRRPYRISTLSAAEIDRVICETEPPPPGVSGDLDNILLMALRKEPARRYRSVREFAQDIERALTHRPVLARPDTLRYRSAKFFRRNRLALAVAAALAISLGAGVVVSLYQARRAERRFEQVRRLAHSFLFDIDGKIQQLPGSTAVSEEIVGTALQYLEGLSQDAGNDAGLLAELAAAYEVVGDVQGNPNVSNLGKADQALASYRKAQRIAESLDQRHRADANTLNVLCNAYLRIGDILEINDDHPAAIASFQKGLAVAEKMRASGQRAYSALAESYSRVGRIAVSDGDPVMATDALTKGLAVGIEWNRAEAGRETQFVLIRDHIDLALALKIHGDFDGAISHSRQAETLALDLYRQFPHNPTYSFLLARAYLGAITGSEILPVALFNAITPAENIRKSIDLNLATAKADPTNITARTELARSYLVMGVAARSTNPQASVVWTRKAIETESSQPMRAGEVHRLLGESLRFAGRYPEALAELQTALAMDETVAATDMLWERDAIATLIAIGHIQVRTGGIAEADSAYLRAQQRAFRMWSKTPADIRINHFLSAAYEGIGQCALRRGDWTKAIDSYRKSLDLWQTWPQRGVSGSFDRSRAAQAAKAIEQCRSQQRRAL